MVNKQHWLLIHLFSTLNHPITIRKISLDLGIPYMTLSRMIHKLSQQGLILLQKVGNYHTCQLNLQNPILKHHLIISSEEITNEYLSKQSLISILRKTILKYPFSTYTALLFGSYAKNKQEKHSDIDLAIISKNKTVLQKLKKEMSYLEKLYETEINILIFTPNQFREMLTSKEENVGKQIIKNNIILYNSELFWEVVLNGI
ncbi:MAG: nucleotidyltransferase domain-containing protein [Nanoarchaeota archaeon]